MPSRKLLTRERLQRAWSMMRKGLRPCISKRRRHFMIEGQNRLYQVFDQPHFRGFDRGVIDRLKRSFYDCLDVLNRFEDTAAFKNSTRDLVEGLFPTAPGDAEDLKQHARQFVRLHLESINLLVDRLAAE